MPPSAYWREESTVAKAQNLEPRGLRSSSVTYQLGDLWQVTATSQPRCVNGKTIVSPF